MLDVLRRAVIGTRKPWCVIVGGPAYSWVSLLLRSFGGGKSSGRKARAEPRHANCGIPVASNFWSVGVVHQVVSGVERDNCRDHVVRNDSGGTC